MIHTACTPGKAGLSMNSVTRRCGDASLAASYAIGEMDLKLAVAIVQEEDADLAVRELIAAGLPVTRISTTGGYLKTGSATLLMALNDEQLDVATEVLRRTCKRREQVMAKGNGGKATVGGAVVFLLPLDGIIRL